MKKANESRRRHAVVLGSSMAGLGAARALSKHFERVTLVERDALDETTIESRKGVPQGNHAHGLLASGFRVLEDYFPDMKDDLVRQGAQPGDATGDFLWHQFGAWKLRAPSGLRGVVASRPLLERNVRQRVRAVANVEVKAEHDVVHPLFDAPSARVVGALVKDRRTGEERKLDADLVVDATGRGSSSPKWLAAWGFGETPESVIRCDIGYATALFERRPGDFRSSIGGIVVGTAPRETRSGAVFGIEGDRWMVTLLGMLGDHPPTELEGFRTFARTLAVPDVAELIGTREPLTKIQPHRFPSSRWRRFRKLARFPEGYLIVGDAICSFNPAYGQGMSVALCQAKALDECLAAGDEALSKRFLARADALIDTPWMIAAGEDMRYPAVEGERPPGFALTCRYFERTHHAATRDPVVLRRLFEVAHLVRPAPSMFAPAVALRVLLGGFAPKASSPTVDQATA